MPQIQALPGIQERTDVLRPGTETTPARKKREKLHPDQLTKIQKKRQLAETSNQKSPWCEKLTWDGSPMAGGKGALRNLNTLKKRPRRGGRGSGSRKGSLFPETLNRKTAQGPSTDQLKICSKTPNVWAG